MTRLRIQVGLIHAAVAITLVPMNSTLNRVMIKELALSAALVGILASLPYLLSPIQVAIGSFSDRNPIFGYRRTPYIVLGWLLCIGGLVASPYVAYMLVENRGLGILMGILSFGAWGMGYNFATVSYFSLATELSGEKERSRTIAVMFFIMIVAIIFTSISLGNMLEVYSEEAVIIAFRNVAIAAFVLGLLGIIGLEPRDTKTKTESESYTWGELYQAVSGNKQAARFILYLVVLLIAIFSQDILLEPYGAEAFGLSVKTTSRITSIWGTMFLLSLSIGGAMETRVPKLTQARIGAWMGIASFFLIIISGTLQQTGMFYGGVVLLGLATGLSTVSNLSLMLDMTLVGSVGLFMGVWGMSTAIARLIGNLLAGVVRDVVSLVVADNLLGYSVVFGIEAILLFASLIILKSVDVNIFQERAERQLPIAERAAVGID